MIQDIKPYLEQVKGNTWCVVTGYARIPLYKLDEKRVIMIDSGIPSDGEGIVALLEEKALQLVAILTSHTHPDHIGNHMLLRKRFGAKLYMTGFASATCADPMTMFAVLGGRTGFRGIRKRMGELFTADHILPWEDGEICVEGATFRMITTPGHCAEHLCFITPDNVAYLGDAILSPKLIQAVRLPFCTVLELYIESIRKIGDLNCDRYILAHNSIEEDIRQVVDVSLATLQQRLDTIELMMQTPATMDELVHRFLVHTKGDISSHRSINGVHYNTRAFVAYLFDEGRISMVLEDGFTKYIRSTRKTGGE